MDHVLVLLMWGEPAPPNNLQVLGHPHLLEVQEGPKADRLDGGLRLFEHSGFKFGHAGMGRVRFATNDWQTAGLFHFARRVVVGFEQERQH